MRKRLFVKLLYRLYIMVLLLSFSSLIYAAPLKNVFMSVTQPNGDILECWASGDEFFNYLHDANGNIIIQHPTTGYYTYAQLDSQGKVVASNQVAVNDFFYGPEVPQYLSVSDDIAGIKLSDIDFSINKDLIHEFPAPETSQTLEPLQESFADIGIIGNTVQGRMENVIVMICFAGENQAIDSVIKEKIENVFNGPTQSLNHYMKTVSGGVFELNSTLVGLNGNTVLMYRDSQPRNYYQPYNAATNPQGYTGGDNGAQRQTREHELLRNAVNAINGSALLTGKNLDIDGNGYVDSITFIISGNVDSWAQLLWPHKWSLYTYAVNLNGKRVFDYSFLLLNHTFPSNGNANLGVLCHESLHTFSLPDLYRYTYNGTPVGAWDVMASNTTIPQFPNSHLRQRYVGWGDKVVEITQDGWYTLSPIGGKNGTTAYGIATSNPREFILLEYRSNSNDSGYDTYFDTSNSYHKGLTIARINTNYSGNANRDGATNDEVYIYRPGETITNQGNGSVGAASLSAEMNRISFGNKTVNTGFDGTIYLNNGTNTRYKIYDVSAAGETITFYVSMSDIIAIRTAEELDAVRDYPNGKYRLDNDIDLTAYLAPGGAGYAKWGSAGWLPIGTNLARFTGSFDGNGHKITGLRIGRSNTDFVGLFGATQGAEIKDFGVVIGDIGISGRDYVGGLVGRQYGGESIINSYATGNVTGSGNYTGGLVGYSSDSAIISCYAMGNVTSIGSNVGGLVGYKTGIESIANCYATGNVNGSGYVGGLLGFLGIGGSVINSYATGNVTGSGNSVGGLAGWQASNSNVVNSYATGSVVGNSNVGGIVGSSSGSIINSYRYQYATVNGAVRAENTPTGIHGGIVTASQLMTKATYTGNSWLFNDSAPTAGPWYWDERGFPKINIGAENFPFGFDPGISVISIISQPMPNTIVTQGSISGSLSVSASVTQGATLTYQWYRNTTNSIIGGSIETGATSASFTIPTTLTAAGSPYYFYCVVSAVGAEPVHSDVATVTVNIGSIDPTGVTLNVNSIEIAIGNAEQLTETVSPSNATNKSVTWHTSNATVATVYNGLVTGVAQGKATITVTTVVGGLTDACEVTVTPNINYMISASPLSLPFGSMQTPYIQPAEQTVTITNTGTGQITLTQPTAINYDIGTLSATNLAVTGAMATFTVRPKADLAVGDYNEMIDISGSNEASASVNASFSVTSAPHIPVTSITVSGEGGATSINTDGGTLQMLANVLPTNATDQTVTWSVTAETGDATIDNVGLLSAIADGTVMVRATANDGSGVSGSLRITISGQIIIIRTAAELDAVRNNLSANYKLGNDIDLSAYLAPGGAGHAQWGSEGWLPIGNITTSFTGSFDGNGQKITGLWIDRNMGHVGLFGITSDAVIKNIGVVIAASGIKGGGLTGGLIGGQTSRASDKINIITNSYVTGSVMGGTSVGGLVGQQSGDGTNIISGSHATGNVSGDNNIGGLVGMQSEITTKITDSHATVSVNGNNSVGGLVGWQYGIITNSYAMGNVSGDWMVGGLVGSQNSEGITMNSYSICNVSGRNEVGGLVGSVSGREIEIENSYSTGNVNGDERVGGLVGSQSGGSITYSHSTGDVSGSVHVGGFIGIQNRNSGGSSSISNCNAIGSVIGNTRTGGLAGSQLGGSITYSYSTGDVSGMDFIGGLAGYQSNTGNRNSSIASCYATGNITGERWIGGLIGYQYSNSGSSNTIINCYSTGNVSGAYRIGGLMGAQTSEDGDSNITNCFTTGNATSTSSQFVGGLVGNQLSYENGNNSITNCYATGNVSGVLAGGLIGAQTIFEGGVSTITNSYRYQFATVNGEVRTENTPNGIHGGIRTAAELMTNTTYTGNDWLFNDSAPTVGPWHWDNRNFPKLNMGTENFPFPWDIEPVITIDAQPALNTTVTQGSISGALSVSASVTQGATLTYQWYRNTTNSIIGGSIETGATSASFTIPTTLTAAGSPYYFYCVVSAGGAVSVHSDVAMVTVNIGSIDPTGVTLNVKSIAIAIGGSEQLIETVSPVNATNKNVTWHTSNATVATVYNGLVTGVAQGKATITVTTVVGGFTDACEVTVNGNEPDNPPSISGPVYMELNSGYEATASNMFSITGAEPVTVTKTSGHASITWDETNKKLNIAAGLTPGSYTVVLTASNGIAPNATHTFTLTVINIPPGSAKLYFAPENITAGKDRTFTITFNVDSPELYNQVECVLVYDPELLELEAVTQIPPPTDWMMFNYSEWGKATFSLAPMFGNSTLLSGDTSIAMLRFKALQETSGTDISIIQLFGNGAGSSKLQHQVGGMPVDIPFTTQGCTVTIVDGVATLKASFQWRNVPSVANIEDLMVKWISNNAVIAEEIVTADQNGEAEIIIPSQNSGLTIWVKGERTLAASQYVGTVENASVINIGTLLGGDGNGDNIVDLNDFNVFLMNYGKNATSPGFNRLADFNNDGVVDLNDFNMFLNNYGKTGAQLTAGHSSSAMSMMSINAESEELSVNEADSDSGCNVGMISLALLMLFAAPFFRKNK